MIPSGNILVKNGCFWGKYSRAVIMGLTQRVGGSDPS